MTALRTDQPEFTEGRRGQIKAALPRRIGQRQPVLMRDAATAAPSAHRGQGYADVGCELFDDGLHTGIIDKSSNGSREIRLDVSSRDAGGALAHNLDRMSNTPTEMLCDFAARVRLARRVAGYKTQTDLADVLGVHFSAVSNWERGLQFSTAPDLLKLALALGVTMDWIVGGIETGLTDERKRLLRLNKMK